MGRKSRIRRKKGSESDIENAEARVHKQLKHGANTDEQSVTSVSSISSYNILNASKNATFYCTTLLQIKCFFIILIK